MMDSCEPFLAEPYHERVAMNPPVDHRALIKTYLPHREPFLLLHRVKMLKAWQTCEAEYDIAADNAVFQGHFPDHPIYPGVLIIESLAQCAGLLLQASQAGYVSAGAERGGDMAAIELLAEKLAHKKEPDAALPAPSGYGLLASIDKARFIKPVMPGVTLRCVVQMVRRKPPFYFSNAQAFVADELVAKARISAYFNLANHD